MRTKKLKGYQSSRVGRIEVWQKPNGERLLTTNGFSQGISVSDNVDLTDSYWYFQTEQILIHCAEKNNPSVLWLGLGAGTGPHIIAQNNKYINQTAVEFDPLILKAVKEYFSLILIPNLKIIQEDAYDEIKIMKKKKMKYDAISVDIYINDDPQNGKNLVKETFLDDVFQLLAPGGIVLFNRLAHKEDERLRTENFVRDLKKKYKNVSTTFIKDSRGYLNDIIVVST